MPLFWFQISFNFITSLSILISLPHSFFLIFSVLFFSILSCILFNWIVMLHIIVIFKSINCLVWFVSLFFSMLSSQMWSLTFQNWTRWKLVSWKKFCPTGVRTWHARDVLRSQTLWKRFENCCKNMNQKSGGNCRLPKRSYDELVWGSDVSRVWYRSVSRVWYRSEI